MCLQRLCKVMHEQADVCTWHEAHVMEWIPQSCYHTSVRPTANRTQVLYAPRRSCTL